MGIVTFALALWSALPMTPQPAPPFPRIITDAATITDVAPGVKYADYEMRTVDGPLSIHVIAVNLREPTVQIGTALSNDTLVSPGETVSSMASRTRAVAGVNGDYFDINQTNQPLNILVNDARLIRMPMQRWAIAFDTAKHARFAEYSVSETALLPQGTLPLNTMNAWPPPGGTAVFNTPEYGPLRPLANVTEIQLQPISGTPPFATYSVAGVADNTRMQPPGYYLAVGENVYGSLPLPVNGDTVTISGTATPPLDNVAAAIGGGPLLVKNGAWYADPDGPSKGEFATHMPATAVCVTRDGTLLLFEVDGRQPALSIGILQPQLASLMIAFGAVTGMQFDGGGSSTIVARLPGDSIARVQNSPSDGVERRVADALLVYSDAAHGPAARLYSTPQVVRAMPGSRVPIHIALTDAAGHPARCTCSVQMRVVPASAGRIDAGTFIAGTHSGTAAISIAAGTLHSLIPVHVIAAPAYAVILPEHPALRAGESMQLQVHAFDSRGYPVAIPSQLDWESTDGQIDDTGMFTAQNHDARVRIMLGSLGVTQSVTVGEHAIPLALGQYAQFGSAPRGGPGGLDKDTPCQGCVTLHYNFTGQERAAYANASMPLPQRVLALTADVFGDGNGATLRVALNNAINERFLYTVATVDWRGWRHVEFRLPQSLPQPITFKSLYVINRVGPSAPVKAAGAIAIRNTRVILAGSARNVPK
jgi:exopolysaccharide biosynthesis protein